LPKGGIRIPLELGGQRISIKNITLSLGDIAFEADLDFDNQKKEYIFTPSPDNRKIPSIRQLRMRGAELDERLAEAKLRFRRSS